MTTTTFRHRSYIIHTSLRYHLDSKKVTTTAKWQQNIIHIYFKHQTLSKHHSNIIQTSCIWYSDKQKWKHHQNDSRTSCRHHSDIIQTSLIYHLHNKQNDKRNKVTAEVQWQQQHTDNRHHSDIIQTLFGHWNIIWIPTYSNNMCTLS